MANLDPMSDRERSVPAPWLQDFVDDALRPENVDEFVNRVNDGILAQLPAVAADPLLVQDLSGSTRSQWRVFLSMLLEPEYRHELPGEADYLARSLARRGMELGVLLKVYWVAHQAVFSFVTDITEAPLEGSPGRHEALVFIWGRAGTWIDDSVEKLIETFYEERGRLHQGAVVRRAAIIDALLGDRPPPEEDPSAALGHAVHHHQTGFVVWADTAEEEVGDPLAEAAAATARALGAPPPLTHVAGSRDLWGWCATPVAPDLGALDSLEPLLAEHRLRIAVGLPARGVQGFRSSHTEARAAHRLATGALSGSRVVAYRDVELLCLTAGNEELLRRMVLREVGPLCGAEKNLAMVRTTALAFLAHRSVEDVARELYVHKNTVRYRLARAEELLGHPLTERAAQTELALRHVALFGPPELRP
ncbi:PucR family transcriptional regulator [Nocardioides sp. BGMRC 2183]|nr:PucR family transcriptional regulator [Nocardioides sp. BGMRC 2183]